MYTLIGNMKAGTDVAFGNNITKVQKTSYRGAIDIQFGIYRGGKYDGCLTISLKPSSKHIDWWYNVCGFMKRTEHGRVHAGYMREVERFWPQIKRDIVDIVSLYRIDLTRGIIVAGRSKGAGEALLLIPHLSELSETVICMAIEPAKVCDYTYSAYIGSLASIVTTSYRNDIVTGIPPWFKHTGLFLQNGRRTYGLSVKDHIAATTDSSIWYRYIKEEMR